MPTLVCLFDKTDFTGTFAVDGKVTAKGRTARELLNSSRGVVTFAAEGGRIYRFSTVAKILEVAGLTAIWAIPDIMRDGFAYESATARLEIGGGKITIRKGVLNAPSANLILNGEIDLIEKKIDAIVLVVPFTTLSRIIKLIPLVRYVLAGRVVAIPVKVSGNLERPDVDPLPPSAIGAELLGVGERILKLPLKIIESLVPRS